MANNISTFNNLVSDDCEEYHYFLEKLKRLHNKVDSGDLTDFTELKL